MNSKRPFSTRLIAHLPQTIWLRSGVRIQLRNARDNSEFWHIFTSPEYLALVPAFMKLNLPSVSVIDCGGGIGLFSLLIEHLSKIRILPWDYISYTLIEPLPSNFKQMQQNISRNLPDSRYQLINGLVGYKEGYATLYAGKGRPWGASIIKRHKLDKEFSHIPFVDLTRTLQSHPCFIKIDIEGAEYIFLETYQDVLTNVEGIVIEWHTEMGDVATADACLQQAGLHKVQRSWDNQNRCVDFYAR